MGDFHEDVAAADPASANPVPGDCRIRDFVN